MPRLSEQELFCSLCKTHKLLPACCGKNMEKDNRLFFCPTCGREVPIPQCCGKEMDIRKKVLDIKKELFKEF
jgi:hypothetical protein